MTRAKSIAFVRFTLTALFLFAPFTALTEASGDPGTVNIVVATGEPKDSPLQILGLRPPERVGIPPRVHLRNISSKKILRYWVESLIGNPEGELVSSNSYHPDALRPEESVILPDGDVEVRETILQSERLAFAAKRLLSNCLRVSVIVMRVEFADGTSWALGSAEEHEIWKSTIWPQSGTVCQPSADTKAELEQMEGAGHRVSGPDFDSDTDIRKSYSVSCVLSRIHGKLFAMCPR